MSDKEKIEQIRSHKSNIPVRTPKAAQYMGEKASQLPRPLRLLLLSVDDRQNVGIYIKNLEGFGDVPALLAHLCDLGLIRILEVDEHKQFESERALLVSASKEEQIPEEFPVGVAPMDQVFKETQPGISTAAEQDEAFGEVIRRFRENQKNKRLNWDLQQTKTNLAQAQGISPVDNTLSNSKIFGLMGADEWNRLQEQAKGLAQMAQTARSEVDKLRVKLYRSKAKRALLEKQHQRLRGTFLVTLVLLLAALTYIAWKFFKS